LRNAHEALRVGDWTQIETNSNRIYAFLRHTENETVLVVMNFNRNPVSAEDYRLETEAGLFDGPVTALSLYGSSVNADPEINGSGNFSGYIPFDEIPPQSTHIIFLGQD
jgi:glycosidase